VYEAASASLQRGGATPDELATVSRLQPDRSIRVRALIGLGRVRTLQLEALRVELTTVCPCRKRPYKLQGAWE